ncbi:Sec-independent protein translocase subunit TatA/TatB [Anaeromyxobacter oryzisoli]|uniref:Sec-independent protein translocase subunit TatA/TatB n=1 Tax=Anaeromyxobacter oryzisoli TaxID=2925408 RepID=UPI001F59650C|nr:twin-arginine translocase TatA/TatE family subunit [Anaeromyxobacter sp. SG63]
MFGLSFGELVIIAVLALLLLGPDKLPDAAKTVAKGLKEFKRATEDLKEQVGSELKFDDLLRDEPKIAPRPALVPPVPAAVPEPSGPPPGATTENVPGLEAALAEPAAPQAAGADAAPPAPAAPAQNARNPQNA